LFFIRHGETEHNVAGLLAGVSDSRLTNHGVLQTQRLGKYLATHRNLRFTRIYASDLQRAYMTAGEIQRHQAALDTSQRVPEVVRLDLLREQDFGSLELVPWASRRAQNALDPRVPRPDDPAFRPQETEESMSTRAELFIAEILLPLLASEPENEQDTVGERVAVVSHGLFLGSLWQSLLGKFGPGSVSLGPDVEVSSYGRSLAYLPAWNNTGFLEMTIHRPMQTVDSLQIPPVLNGYCATIHAVNARDHLLDLRRARGGLGSSPFDARQQSLENFFTRPERRDSSQGGAS